MMACAPFVMAALVAGCSFVLHEREKDETVPADQGAKTEFQLRGPRAVIKHSF